MWEYDRIEISVNTMNGLMNEMNKLGKEGWEIIYYHEDKPQKFGADFKVIVIIKRIIIN